MAKQLLDGAQISPAIKQVAGKRVAQYVRADAVWRNTGNFGQFLEFLAEPLARQMPFGA